MDEKLIVHLLGQGKSFYVKGEKMQGYKTESQYRDDIIEICRRIYRNGWVASNDGNVSIRISPGEVLCTPTGMSKGYITQDQLVKVDMDGKKLEGSLEPSSEVRIHLDVYRNKKGIYSAVHAHPPYATAHAVAGIPLDQCVIPEIIISLGSIPLTQYGTPSTREIPDNIRKYLKDHNAFLMQNHGAFTIGADVFQAYYRMESVELFAKISLLAGTLGNVRNITEENVRKIMEIRPRLVRDDDGYAGCRIGDRFITDTDDYRVPEVGEGGRAPAPAGDESITIKKSELVDMVYNIVANIVNRGK